MMLLQMISLTFCLSAIVSASLGPESLWADQDHLLEQGKILGECTVMFGWSSFAGIFPIAVLLACPVM